MAFKDKLRDWKEKYDSYKRKRRVEDERKLQVRATKAKEEHIYLTKKAKVLKAEAANKKTKDKQFKSSTAGRFLEQAANVDFAATTAPYYFGGGTTKKKKKRKAKPAAQQIHIHQYGYPARKAPPKKQKKKRKKKKSYGLWDF